MQLWARSALRSGLLAAVVLLYSCQAKLTEGQIGAANISAPPLVAREWSRHETRLLESLQTRERESQNVESTRMFFGRLTGIWLPSEYKTPASTIRAERQLQELRLWFESNKGRLFWDERLQTISLCSLDKNRGGMAAGKRNVEAVWRAHESVFVDVAQGKDYQIHEFEDAWRFFVDLTNVSIAADHSPVVNLLPTAETASALPALQKWYREHRSALYWDKDTGCVRIRL